MPKKYVTGPCALAVFVLGAVAATPAWAGFEWVAPPAVTTYPAPPDSGYAPRPLPSAASNAPEIISPVIISGTPSSAVPITPSPFAAETAAPTAVAPALPITPPLAPAAAAPAPSYAPLPASPPRDATVQGFASQIPLSIALRQILPVGFSYVINADVDANILVSYKGGRGWRETLDDMLAPVGLVAHQQGTALTVARAGGGMPVAAASAAPMAALPITPPASAPSYAPAPVVDSGMPRNAPPSDGWNHMAAAAVPAPVLASPVRDVPSFNVGSAPAGYGEGWSAERGDTLRKVLTAWCKRAGVELQWVAEYDYPMEASAHFGGSFEDAVRQLLAGFETARPQPVAELHTNPGAGQKLLVVQARGNNYAN